MILNFKESLFNLFSESFICQRTVELPKPTYSRKFVQFLLKKHCRVIWSITRFNKNWFYNISQAFRHTYRVYNQVGLVLEDFLFSKKILFCLELESYNDLVNPSNCKPFITLYIKNLIPCFLVINIAIDFCIQQLL